MPHGPEDYDASVIEGRPANVAAQFLDRVRRSGSREAYRYPDPAASGGWSSLTWDEVGERVRHYAAGLLELGLEREQRVGIASATRYEWILADLAVMCAGGATTTVYPSTRADDTGYILADSECRFVFVEDDDQLAKLVEQRAELPKLEKVVTFTGSGDGDWVIGLDDLAALGEKRLADQPEEIDTIAGEIPSDALATLVYTSGTTGRPKGVRLRHDSWVYEGVVIQAYGFLTEDDLQYLWLPMSHVFGKVLLCSQLACGFPTAVDGRVDKIIDNLAVVRPTFMGAAPRIFEKAYGRITTMTEAEGGLKKAIFDRAFAVGLDVDARRREGRSVPPLLAAQHALFDRLVFAKVRERFGGRVRFFISGSAALNRDVALWFNAAGIVILEGYGLTETSAGAFVNHPDKNKFGTVGPVFPGEEVRIAEDGEVLLKGPNIMDGYHRLPEETASALVDGWLHTGDIGELDDDGYLRITDRKKDLFKTSGGKYVAPSAIESRFKAVCPYVSNFLVIGNERNYCIALVALDPEAIAEWAERNGVSGDYTAIVTSPKCREMVQGYVDELNSGLNRWETVKKFEILEHDLTIESGELTPSLKVKRKVVETNNADRIDALYG
ncbi:long-chain fatty acid--CoA ligase [Nocardioides mangrovicus]|uniref:Acyl-CoA synthetase n=1 Tax=Nocardioides mangrovicus TaxID=2478913 RepID=A0A3L8P2G1_9ACTN|nr:AMP-dependent synthetase/ligase [Nocardioides mangrovicus]RLV49596.1 long-chain fatty acid--CoA ligase [Nocardioides mangrovicus]